MDTFYGGNLVNETISLQPLYSALNWFLKLLDNCLFLPMYKDYNKREERGEEEEGGTHYSSYFLYSTERKKERTRRYERVMRSIYRESVYTLVINNNTITMIRML